MAWTTIEIDEDVNINKMHLEWDGKIYSGEEQPIAQGVKEEVSAERLVTYKYLFRISAYWTFSCSVSAKQRYADAPNN